MPRIFIDGSSTAYGLWGGPTGGWADRIKFAHMPDRPDKSGKRPLWKVYNLAAPHRTLDEIVSQLPQFVENYRRDDTVLVTVVMAGQVESRYSNGSSETDMPIREFVHALRGLVNLPTGLILVGTTPVVADKVRTVGHLACRYEPEQRLIYDRAVKDVAAEADAPYVNVMDSLLEAQNAGERIMDDDGLHPNARGHTIIYNLVHQAIEHQVTRIRLANSS